MKMNMKTLVGASVLAALVSSGAAMAGASANIGATSNYVWRGITQSADGSAISGGLDYSHDSGVYVGTWASSTAWGSPELDLYGGFAKTFGGVKLDLGAYRYDYPSQAKYGPGGAGPLAWTEGKLTVSYGPAKVTYGHGNDVFGNVGVNSNYGSLDLTHTIKDDLSVGAHVGYWKFGEALNKGWAIADPVTEAYAKDSFTEYGVSLTKGEFTFTASGTTLKKEDYTMDGSKRVYITYTKSFDL